MTDYQLVFGKSRSTSARSTPCVRSQRATLPPRSRMALSSRASTLALPRSPTKWSPSATGIGGPGSEGSGCAPGSDTPRQIALFPHDRPAPTDDERVVRIRLDELSLQRPRQWGGCWLALELYRQLGLDTFFAAHLPASRKGTRWDQSLPYATEVSGSFQRFANRELRP